MACHGWMEVEVEGQNVGQTWAGVVGQQQGPLEQKGWLCGEGVGAGLPHDLGLGFLKEAEGLHHEMGVEEQLESGFVGVGALWIHLK